jgi:hypothetical protein
LADEINESEAEELAQMMGQVIVGTIACISSVVMELSAAGILDHKQFAQRLKARSADIKSRGGDEGELSMPIKMLERLSKMLEKEPTRRGHA